MNIELVRQFVSEVAHRTTDEGKTGRRRSRGWLREQAAYRLQQIARRFATADNEARPRSAKTFDFDLRPAPAYHQVRIGARKGKPPAFRSQGAVEEPGIGARAQLLEHLRRALGGQNFAHRTDRLSRELVHEGPPQRGYPMVLG